MAYTALYRAYRPQKFSEVVGQRHIVTTLQNAIKRDKVAHAYLFSGPRGTGKTTMAKILAKALNCEKNVSVEPCNVCINCVGINKGMIPDVIEIDAASNNGADDIRELREGVKFLPSVARYKVYIIDEVHMLSTAAFNALLKTLEEPPKHVIFILATTEPYKLPNTILSRCQRFDFQAISVSDIIGRLKEVVKEESIMITDEAIRLIAEFAEGGMRDALSLLDQSISFSSDDLIDEDDVLSVSGNTSSVTLLELLDSCLEKKDAKSIELLDEILKAGKETPRVINDLIIMLRDILLTKNGIKTESKAIYENQKYNDFAKKVNTATIYNWLDILNEAQNNVRFSNQKRTYLELSILKMSDTKLNDSYIMSEKIERLEHDFFDLESKIKNYDGASKIIKEEKSFEIPKPKIEEIKKYKEEVIIPEETASEKENQDIETYEEADIESSYTESVIENSKEEEILGNVQVTRETDPTVLNVGDVEAILNNPNKAKKELIINMFSKFEQRYPNLYIIQIMCNGEIVAASDDKFIIVLKDVGFSNRAMKYENYIKIMEILNAKENIATDYICLPQNIWKAIKEDYYQQYKSGILKPVLKDIDIPVKKRIDPTKEKKIDEELEKVYELFGSDVVKIVEE